MYKLSELGHLMDFSAGDIIAMIVAAGGFIFSYGNVRAKNATTDRRISDLENKMKSNQTDLDTLGGNINRLTTTLAVLEATLKDTREDRLRYHTEVQVALSEIRKDQTRMLSAMAQMQVRANVKSNALLHDPND